MTANSTNRPATGALLLVRRYLSPLIIALGVLWVIYIVARELPTLQAEFRVTSIRWLAYTVAAGTAALMVTAPVFRRLLRTSGGVRVSYGYAAKLLFVAQLLRHLPGRIWGMVYLVKETHDRIPPAAMIRANLDVMVYSLGFSLLVAAALFTAESLGRLPALALVFAGMAASVCALRLDCTGAALRSLSKMSPAIRDRWHDALMSREPPTWADAVFVTACFSLIWLLYLSVWWAFPRIFPGLTDVNIWLLCAAYSAAWAVGYMAMLTPGGLGVREAGFIAMSTSLTSLPTLTFLAVFVRLWQILTELIVFALFSLLKFDAPAPVVTASKETA